MRESTYVGEQAIDFGLKRFHHNLGYELLGRQRRIAGVVAMMAHLRLVSVNIRR